MSVVLQLQLYPKAVDQKTKQNKKQEDCIWKETQLCSQEGKVLKACKSKKENSKGAYRSFRWLNDCKLRLALHHGC